MTYVHERQMKVINLCIGHSRRNATGIVQTLHHTLRVFKIKIPRGIDRIGAVDRGGVNDYFWGLGELRQWFYL